MLFRNHARFLVLLVLFTAGVIAQMVVLPRLEASDEVLHFTYVEWLRAEHVLPDRAAYLTNCTHQESGQPPLTYAIGALVLNALNVPPVDCMVPLNYIDAIKNPWSTPMDGWNRVDNGVAYLNVRNIQGYPVDSITLSARILRLISLPFGLLAVIGAYASGLEVFKRQSWALVCASIFGFMPMMVDIASYWTNDISGVAFSSLIVWWTLRLLRTDISPFRLLMLGILFGLGTLCKVNVMLLLPGSVLALIIVWRKRRLSFAYLILSGFLLLLPIVLLVVPWVMYGINTYQDPIGFRTHVDPKFNYNPPLTLIQTLPMLPEMYLTYIGKFGFSKMYLDPLTYTAVGVIFLLSIVGYVAAYLPSFSHSPLRWIREFWKNEQVQQASVLMVVTLVVAVGFFNWLRQIYFVSGRLMYPAHVPISLAITGGLYLLVRRWPRFGFSVRTYAMGAMAVSGVLIPAIVIYSAVMPPRMLTRDQLPALQGAPIDFDHTIRFLGYQQDSRVINRSIYTLHLCWEVLRTTERFGAFSVKLVHDGVILADRTSIHGMGHYNSSLWEAGAIFCDQVDIRIDDPDLIIEPQPEPAQVYDVLLVMLDAKTQAVNWQATTVDGTPIDLPIITQVVTPAEDMRGMLAYTPEPSTVQFPEFADVAGYSLNGDVTAGSKLSVDLLWHVTGTLPDSWAQFIHLNGPNGAIPLADGVPRGGNYPTWGWSPGEYIFDRWPVQLPEELPPGDYEVLVGFYRQDSGERMPVTVDGVDATNRSAVLVRFTIP